jgi:hypothetical protein
MDPNEEWDKIGKKAENLKKRRRRRRRLLEETAVEKEPRMARHRGSFRERTAEAKGV